MKIKRTMWRGIVLTLVVACLGRLLAIWLPMLGAEALAMFVGILLGNTVCRDSRFATGTKWAEKYPIEFGIVLLGLTITLTTIVQLGAHGILFIVCQMIVTIVGALLLGRWLFRVHQRSALLMAAGNAVCGSSAIAAVAPTIGASDDERRTSVATVSLVGTVLLLLLPTLGPWLLGQHNVLLGALVGGVLQSVGQVVGTASLINPTVVTYATLFKMLRVILLSVIVLIFSRLVRQPAQPKTGKKLIVPWFIIGFVICLLANSFLSLPVVMTQFAKEVAGFCGIINLAGIGLNLKWQTIRQSGTRFLGYGLLIAVVQVISALLLIHVLFTIM